MITRELHQRLVKQDVPGLRRREFFGEKMELAVWQNADGDVVHFRILLLPDRILHFQYGEGVTTGRGEFPRLKRRYFMRPEKPGEKVEELPDVESVTPDERPELTTVKLAFDRLVDEPPAKSKRSLSLVAHVLFEVLTSTTGSLEFKDGKLPAGTDSVYGDPETAQLIRDAAERKQKYGGIFRKFMAMLTDGAD